MVALKSTFSYRSEHPSEHPSIYIQKYYFLVFLKSPYLWGLKSFYMVGPEGLEPSTTRL